MELYNSPYYNGFITVISLLKTDFLARLAVLCFLECVSLMFGKRPRGRGHLDLQRAHHTLGEKSVESRRLVEAGTHRLGRPNEMIEVLLATLPPIIMEMENGSIQDQD